MSRSRQRSRSRSCRHLPSTRCLAFTPGGGNRDFGPYRAEKTGPRTTFDSRTGEEERNRRSATRRRLRGAPWCAKIGLWLLLLAVGAVTSREDEDAGHEDLTTISLELRQNSQRSKTSNVLEAVATVAFEASVTAPSVNPTRVPDLTTVPVAVSRPLLSRTALR